MLLFRGVPEQTSVATVLTIGNFDGVHRGHQALLERLLGQARRLGLPATVLTFEPHPREYFECLRHPETGLDGVPARLSALREKLSLLEICGVDRVHVCRFNERLAALTADEFIETILVRGLGVKHLIIGDDFRFGAGRKGDFALLHAAGECYGFTVEAMHTVAVRQERASSSAVREALLTGDLERAANLLGRPYRIAGRVIHGDKIGRTLGCPTANIALKRRRVPLEGVFTCTVSGADLSDSPAVASVGTRPTVDGRGRVALEVHLLDYNADLYGAHLEVHFLHKLRDQVKYSSLDALMEQIRRDVADTRGYFSLNKGS